MLSCRLGKTPEALVKGPADTKVCVCYLCGAFSYDSWAKTVRHVCPKVMNLHNTRTLRAMRGLVKNPPVLPKRQTKADQPQP